MIGRYWRALTKAISMTLRGEKISTSNEKFAAQFPKIAAWTARTAGLVDEVLTAARSANLQPETLMLHVERRDLSMATILNTVRYHAAEEFPHVLVHEETYARLAIQATTMNDYFLVGRLAETTSLPPSIKATLAVLQQHLSKIPTENE